MMQPHTRQQPSFKAPDWDRKAVAAPYLRQLRDQASFGSFNGNWVDDMLTGLAAELRAVYNDQDVDRALDGLDRVFAHIDTLALEARTAAQYSERELAQGQSAGVHRHWRAAKRRQLFDHVRLQTITEPVRRTLQSALTRAAAIATSGVHIARMVQEAFAQRAAERKATALQHEEQIRKEARERAAKWDQHFGAQRVIMEAAKPVARNAERSVSSGRARHLDGNAMRGSSLTTWLILVVLCWFSLLWGALLSAPFGIGLGLLATFGGGIIAVPLWGTIFGFFGMGSARDSTLREVGFTPLPADHPLAKSTAAFAAELNIPVPRVGTMTMFNAFAMGVSHRDATVALGAPLLKTLSDDEAAAVLGHELGHIVNGDMRKMMLMRTFQNATVWYMLSQGLKQFVRWVICWASELAILSSSRRREYWADAIGAALTSKEAMISALRKLENGPALSGAENTHARFMVRGRASGLASTHPSFAARIDALERETYLKRLPWKA